jgi:hypothetical protein
MKQILLTPQLTHLPTLTSTETIKVNDINYDLNRKRGIIHNGFIEHFMSNL